ncbi:MAG: 5'-nucleotidase C-terminal domain-containing protein [Mycoplasmoidaceae bacterium]|nr:5'-nucleotidase C-terminal domain-containing protein [Mycoplasmoidaceae bacterium]
MNDKGFTGVDASICNGPAVRSGLTGTKGSEQDIYDVTYNDLYSCIPFDNTTVIMRTTVKAINDYFITYLGSTLDKKFPPNFSNNKG